MKKLLQVLVVVVGLSPAIFLFTNASSTSGTSAQLQMFKQSSDNFENLLRNGNFTSGYQVMLRHKQAIDNLIAVHGRIQTCDDLQNQIPTLHDGAYTLWVNGQPTPTSCTPEADMVNLIIMPLTMDN